MYAAGDTISFWLRWQNFDGAAYEPSDYDVEVVQVNVDDQTSEVVTPDEISLGLNARTGLHLYQVTAEIGHYIYFLRAWTDDLDVLSQELNLTAESGDANSDYIRIPPDYCLSDDDNTLTLYDTDGETILAIYDCEDAAGDPAHRNIKRFRRRLS